jgi:uncharacterized membrane protein YqaE (UPF0057 family)
MKKTLTTILLLIIGVCFNVEPVSATIEHLNSANQFKSQNSMAAISPEMAKMDLDKFLTLTPSKYKEITGKKLGFKKTLELKAAQKMLSKKLPVSGSSDIPKGLFIVLAILGWAWLAMGIMDDWKGNDWWVCLLLTVLCWIPGVIYALTKMGKYYK